MRTQTAYGTDYPHAKLTEGNVRAIRDNKPGWTRKQWADVLGVHVRTVDSAARYETYRNVI